MTTRIGRHILVVTDEGKRDFLFVYDASDPWAVQLSTWTVARDTLHTGMFASNHDGDFRTSLISTGVMLLEFRGMDKTVFTCQVQVRDIENFLDATTRVVPFGAEKMTIPDTIDEMWDHDTM